MKAKKELNKAITKLVRPFGIKKARMASEWMFDFGESKVEYTLDQDWSDEAYNDFLKNEFNLDNPNIFVISLLHEIGHHMTEDDFDDMDDIAIFVQKQRTLERLATAKSDEERKIMEVDYFKIPDEYAATAWAVDFYTNHRKECKKMVKKVGKAIRKYKKARG